MARKGKRGDDSDEDEKPVVKAPDTTSKSGKSKKSRGAEDDDEVADVSHKLKGAKIRGDDDDAGAGKGKKPTATKARGKDEDDEVPKGGKKSKKGRRGDDSDVDDADDGGKGHKGMKEAPATKGKAKGRHAKEDSDDHEGHTSKSTRKDIAAGHSDGSGDEDSDSAVGEDDSAHVRGAKTASKPAVVAPAAGKKPKKAKKGRHHEEDDDESDDDVDPLRALANKGKGRLAALSDSDSDPVPRRNPLIQRNLLTTMQRMQKVPYPRGKKARKVANAMMMTQISCLVWRAPRAGKNWKRPSQQRKSFLWPR
jgi:hypothetical protein